MAKQLDLIGTAQIIPTALHTEMERSYLEYAMSVIVGRALPDVRDGLKPVHRRILYAMHELGLTPDRPFRKCARVVGDVLGKYHPHGDQAVYDALVRMVQVFSSRYPLLAGHGNFGSVDNDPPAAMRYTETRLAPIAQQSMLGEISDAVIDFTSNFDNSQQEPVVLPAQLPNLLLNGCSGIAVGMATNIPPHNLGELVDGLIALIDKPNLSDEKLWKLIPGPDFPTGGEIVDTKGIEDAYRTGRGIIPVRGVTRIEQIRTGKRRRTKPVIVITELPFQVNKAAWIEKVADLVNQGKVDGIGDIRDESDRDGMRVVIELKRDGKPQELLRQLYKQTPLQQNFGVILLTLVNNKPCQLSLREILEEFLRFREETLTRRYTDELEQAQRRIHLVEGLLAALNQLDEVIDILRNAPDGTTAKGTLQERLGISDSQADSILAMPLRRLTGLERQKLETEQQELQEQIAQLELLLRDRKELLKTLKKDLRSLKRKFSDQRRTRIRPLKEIEPPKTSKKGSSTPSPVLDLDLQTPIPKDAVVEINRKGAICWHSPPPKVKPAKKPEDIVIFRQPISQRSQLITITESGKAYPITVADIPSSGGRTTPLIQLLPSSVQNKREGTLKHFFVPKDLNKHFLVLMTEKGRIKRLAGSELEGLTNRGAQLIKIKAEDALQYIGWATEKEQVLIATSAGRIVRFPVDDQQMPIMGRTAQGNQATRVRVNERIVGCATVNPQQEVLIVTQQGYAKRLQLDTIRQVSRGDIGTQTIQFRKQSDHLISILPSPGTEADVPVITSNNRVLYFQVQSVQVWAKDGYGDSVLKLESGEVIQEVVSDGIL
ncbi:DNA topoisomerase 4 subunit A [Spirulina sp. CS-785/01]|uniref:DNA gyrase/topoisomerase IV subunit A n=1 Tax=Spirulina sp. CS-785/01 TaxID=3021716 RepID=UPI00232B1585|nr:DNA topoisomerase (ATP-hydrolyzing) [Spirulina sp. CS-785/01]MDB9313171.1 DNA topoisomerase 4 subunit A [Spirulina sp. CS-785/01]